MAEEKFTMKAFVTGVPDLWYAPKVSFSLIDLTSKQNQQVKIFVIHSHIKF